MPPGRGYPPGYKPPTPKLEDIPGYSQLQQNRREVEAMSAKATSGGSFLAMMITLACCTVAVIVWLTWRFLRNIKKEKEAAGGGSLPKKSNLVKTLQNATMRTKCVAVWLKATRYVKRGITDEHLFKQIAAGKTVSPVDGNAQTPNPFVVRDLRNLHDDDDDDAHDDGALLGLDRAARKRNDVPERHLAIFIGVDAPALASAPQQQPQPRGGIAKDCEKLADSFSKMQYFGSSYKTVVLSSSKASTAPTSVRLAELMRQLSEAHRSWDNVVVFVSAPARAVPKDFIDASVFKSEVSDVTKISHFARRSGVSATTADASSKEHGVAEPPLLREGSAFLGGVGVEFLGDREHPEDPCAWVDLGLLLDRLRLVTKRGDEATPIVVLTDLTFTSTSELPTENLRRDPNGVRAATQWLHAESLAVQFDAPPSHDTTEPLVVTKEELQKFVPDPELLRRIDRLDRPNLFQESLGLFDHLSVVLLGDAAGGIPSTAKGNVKHVTKPWTQLLLKAVSDSALFPSVGSAWDPFASGVDLKTFGPGEIGSTREDVLSSLSSVAASSSQLGANAYHLGLLSVDSLRIQLQRHAAPLASGESSAEAGTLRDGRLTFYVAKLNKLRGTPLGNLPLAVQVALMPRPLHTRPSPSMAAFLRHVSSFEVLLLALFRLKDSIGRPKDGFAAPRDFVIGAPIELDDVPRRQAAVSAGAWELYGYGPRCGKTTMVRALCWNADVLRLFTNGVVYVDLNDFPPSLSLPDKCVDVISYLLRVLAVTVQFYSLQEAVDLLRQLLFHAEAKYLIVLDHCDEAFRDFVFETVLCDTTSSVVTVSLLITVMSKPWVTASAQTSLLTSQRRIGGRVSVVPAVVLVESTVDDHLSSEAVVSMVGGGNICRHRSGAALLQSVRAVLKQLPLPIDMDILPLLRPLVQQGESKLLSEAFFATHAADADCTSVTTTAAGDCAADRIKEWGMAEILESAKEFIFNVSTNSTSPSGFWRSDAAALHITPLHRLIVLQSLSLVPLLFPWYAHADASTPKKSPIHLVRLVAVVHYRLSVWQFTSALSQLVRIGIVLIDDTSCVRQSTARSVVLEDPQAALLDTDCFIRWNAFFGGDRLETPLLHWELFKDTTSTQASPPASFAALMDLVKGQDAAITPATLAEKTRVSLIATLLPFMKESAALHASTTTGMLLETLTLASQVLPISLLHHDEAQGTAIALSQSVRDAFSQPWFVSKILEFTNVRTVTQIFSQLEETLSTAAAVARGGAGGGSLTLSTDLCDGLRSAASRAAEVTSILKRNAFALHRNPYELWSIMTLQSSYFRVEEAARSVNMSTDNEPSSFSLVLSQEPPSDGTAHHALAYDGGLLAVSKLFLLDCVADAAAASVTTVSAVEPGLFVVGRQDGTIQLVRLPPVANCGKALLVETCSSDASPHRGGAITEIFVYRRFADGSKFLVTCSRATRTVAEWEGLNGSLTRGPRRVSDRLPLREEAERCIAPWCDAALPGQEAEISSLHRFFATLVKPHPTNVAAVAQAHLGKPPTHVPTHPSLAPCGSSEDQNAYHSTVLLRYGLADLYRSGCFNETQSSPELNALHVTHADGASAASATFTLPELQQATAVACGTNESAQPTLTLVVGCSTGELWMAEIRKEI